MKTTTQHKIVFIETNQTRRDYLRSIITSWGYIPFSFEKETICLDNLSLLNPNLVISSLLPLERAFRFVNTLKTINYSLPVLIISDDERMYDFININGFTDVLTVKVNFQLYEIRKAIDSILTKGSKRKTITNFPLIIGQNHEMLKIKKIIPELSQSKETVFIKGEFGTGKEHVARALHYTSAIRNNSFVKVNTAELTHELLESKLFGYGNGNFTGTKAKKNAEFENANKGTLFFKEIDKIPAALQGNLIYFLEKDEVKDDKNKKHNLRVIASTSADIDLLAEKDKFRKDLYFRLNTINIEIPPLKNRIEDIPLLTDYFADRFCMEFGRSYYNLSKRVKKIFSSYHWPGNIEQLKNVVKSIVLQGNEDSLVEKLSLSNQTYKTTGLFDCYDDIYALERFSDIKNYIKGLSNVSLKDISREYIARTERIFMKKALEQTNWNRKKAAIALNISYKSILNKIRAYNLT